MFSIMNVCFVYNQGEKVSKIPNSWQFLKNLNTEWPNNSTTKFILENWKHMSTQQNLYENVQSNIIYNSQKVKIIPMSIRINKMWFIHTIEYDSAINRNEVLIYASTWTNLENIMSRERCQTQKATYCMSLFI